MNHFKKDTTFFKPQTVSNKTSQIEEGKKNKNLEHLHAQRKIWKPHTQNSLYVVIYCIIDSAKVDNKVFQLMRCHLCYPNLITIANSITQLKK